MLTQSSIQRLCRLFGWPDSATATMAATFYLFMSIVVGGWGVYIAVSTGVATGPVRLALVVVLLAVHLALHWFAVRLLVTENGDRRIRRAAYWAAQAGLILAFGVLTAHRDMTIGLWMALLAETAALLWPDWRAVALSACIFLVLMTLNVIRLWGLAGLVSSLPIIGLLLAGLLLFALVLVREGRARQSAQALVRELEIAKSRLEAYAEEVEELTISQERQRMAREMHDTLAQGLAGVILQLEAADGYLEGNRSAEARAVVGLAMQRARQTLHEARRAIHALRSTALEQQSLAAALAGEVSEFEAASGVPARVVVEGEPGAIAPDVAQTVLRIVQESLSNVRRHAHAGCVEVRLAQSGSELQLTVHDDGQGFDPEAALQRPDCFGLQGMHERARRIGATLRVESAWQAGTTLVLTLEGSSGPALAQSPRLRLGVEGSLYKEEASQ